jgi:hypothetical protein
LKNISITFFPLFLCAALYAPLHAQTAEEIQALLQTPAVNYAQAARFVLEAADVSGSYDKTSGQDAVRFAVENKWLPKKADAGGAISLENLSLLIMKAFNLKGGPMYSLVKNAHYSYREMVFKDLIRGRSDPRMKVSGYTMLLIVNRLLYRVEDTWEFTEQPAALTTDETLLEEDTL